MGSREQWIDYLHALPCASHTVVRFFASGSRRGGQNNNPATPWPRSYAKSGVPSCFVLQKNVGGRNKSGHDDV